MWRACEERDEEGVARHYARELTDDPLVQLRLQSAQAALDGGRLDEVGQWLHGVHAAEVPAALTANWKHPQAKFAMAEQRWRDASRN